MFLSVTKRVWAMLFALVCWSLISLHTSVKVTTEDPASQELSSSTLQELKQRHRNRRRAGGHGRGGRSPGEHESKILGRRERLGVRRRVWKDEEEDPLLEELEHHMIGYDAKMRERLTKRIRARSTVGDVGKPINRQSAVSVATHVAPKQIPLNVRPVVCTTRPQGQRSCRLEACPDSEGGSTDYGFVKHDGNSRGSAMMISGSAVAGSGCAISHKYKFVYIHVLKSGGMTIKGFLKNALCDSTAMPCEHGRDKLEIINCNRAVSQHPDYFVWSFVRNPFARMYSGFAMADSMRRKGRGHLPFQNFVRHPGLRSNWTLTARGHFAPQFKFLFDANQCPVFDFLGRLERFNEDMQVVLDQIKSPELQRYFDRHKEHGIRDESTAFGQRKKMADHNGVLQKAYHAADLVELVAEEYATDFNLLRYDNSTVPL